MGKTGFKTCQDIIKNIRKRGFTKEVPIQEVHTAIKQVAGLDHRTMEKYSQALRKMGFLKPINSKIWAIEESE